MPGQPEPPDERRQAPRAVVAFMVRYRRAESGGQWSVSPMKDLSRGGARFMADLKLAPGQKLELQLLLPYSQEPVSLRAKVAWARAGLFNTTEIGVAFDAGDGAIMRAVDAAIAQLLKKPEGGG
jgi:hypothetical protein